MNLTFKHPHAIYDNKGDISRWFIHSAEFIFSNGNDIWKDIPPFPLDIINEKDNTIINKLGDNFTDIRGSDSIRSFFMNDGRFVGIQWNHKNNEIKRSSSLIWEMKVIMNTLNNPPYQGKLT